MDKKITINCDIEIIEWIDIISKHYRITKKDLYNDLLKRGIAYTLENDTNIIVGESNNEKLQVF